MRKHGRLERLFIQLEEGITRGLKIFFFYLAVLLLCRLLFFLGLREYLLPTTEWGELLLAIITGQRLSIQTAGLMTLVTVLPAGLVGMVKKGLNKKVEGFFSALCLGVTGILFVASFPYYQQFHSKFNQLIFNTVNEDIYALFISLCIEFYLPLLVLLALFIGWLWWYLLQRLLVKHRGYLYKFQSVEGLFFYGIFLFGLLTILYRLILFGGALTWEEEINWENAGVTRDKLLNEGILDDYQALYRAYALNSRMQACNGLNYTPEDIKVLAGHLSKKEPVENNLTYYLQREAEGNSLPQYNKIFLILGESYASWPLREKYKDLHIADNMKALIEGENSAYCGRLLPNGASTVSALTGVVTGLADANLYLTTLPMSFAGPYPTALAPQLEALGYDTFFWYAGPDTWENIGDFVKAQGFNHFYGQGDMPQEATGTVWGCDDEYLYQRVLEGVAKEKEKSLHIILNVSNHSPYMVDLEAKGFDEEVLKKNLPAEVREDEWLIRQLGHYWYEDRELAGFIRRLLATYPDALIMVAGDHADRYNIEKNPTLEDRYNVPLLLFGKGIDSSLLPEEAVGSHIDIAPTLLELVAPQGFSYKSLGTSLTLGNNMAVNYGFWLTKNHMGSIADLPPELSHEELLAEELMNYINAIWSISWWIPARGLELTEEAAVSENK